MQNRLYHVNDAVATGLASNEDISNPGYIFTNNDLTVNIANNFSYDEIGNLTRNSQKEIEEITWTVTGKVKEVTRSLGSSKKNLRFQYDALCNRTAKYVYDNNWTLEKTEFYFRDATGNVMSIYTLLPDAQQQAVSYAQTETFTYGSSRVATNKETTELISPVPQGNIYSNKLGYKHFELTNHLGNILTTISDIKEQQNYDSDNEVDCYTAQILSNSDYYPFGVNMTERSYNNTGRRYGFNGKENDEELETMDFGARLLDGDLGVWLAGDPLAMKFPSESSYIYAGDSPIVFADVDGKYKWPKGQEHAYAKNYPLLTKYLSENIQKDIMNSPNIMAGLYKYSLGNLTTEEVRKTTSWGKGPAILIRDNPGGMEGANGFYNTQTGNIEISTKLAKQLENASDKDREAALFSFFVTLTHETVHYGDLLDNSQQTSDDPSGWGGEPGWYFMMDVFYTGSVEVGGENEKVYVPRYDLDHRNIEDSKQLIEMNRKDNKSDVIPTVPTKDNDKYKETE